jgi:hypothetical protein
MGIVVHIKHIISVGSLQVIVGLDPAIADIYFFDTCCSRFNIFDTVGARNLLGNKVLFV